jgi:hypothetical protein
MSPRDPSQRQPHDDRPEPARDGERPLLQGHLTSTKHHGPRPDVVRRAPRAEASSAAIEDDEPDGAAKAEGIGPEAKGKRTRGKDEIATRRHLEGSEQNPG